MVVCRDVIHHLESAQEYRNLEPAECDLLSNLKLRLLGLSAIEKVRAREKSIITWQRKCDGNTKYF
jgi:hypothetical protein